MKKIFVIITILATICFAQYGYWGHYLLDKAYEENPDFLMPQRTLTMKMESIGEEMLGLFTDTLSNMSINPALLAKISHNQIQIDFANQKPIEPVYNHYYPHYDYGINARFIPPYYQAINKREISTLFRAIGTYQSEMIPVKLAFSYELIKYTGDYFEDYSYGGYSYGYDAFNEKAMDNAAVQAPDIMSAGDDTKSKLSHKLNLISALELSQKLSAGVKLSYFTDNIDGDYRNFNRSNSYEYDYENYYDNMDSRDIKIEQFGVTVGLNYQKNKNSIGLSGGWIQGTDNQKRLRADTSYYFNDYPDFVDYECFYQNNNSAEYLEKWENSGNTGFISFNGNHEIQNFNVLFRAEYLKNSTDITNNGQSIDTSFYHYSYFDNYNSTYYLNENISGSWEQRRGNGSLHQSKSTIGFALQGRNENKNFSIGLVYQQFKKDKEVIENSIDERESKNISYYQLLQWRNQNQNVDLLLTRNEKIINLKIPVSFVFNSRNGWRLRTTLTKIIGSREAEEEVLITYNTFHYKDLSEEISKHNNELYKATPEKESIDRIQFRAYVEGDVSDSITLFVLFNDLFVSKGEEYRYYNNDSNLFNIGNWKFGVGFKL